MSKLITYELKFPSSILSSSSMKEFEDFRTFIYREIENSRRNPEEKSKLLLLQQGQLTDQHLDWHDELSEQVLLDELYHRLIRLRKLFSDLRSSPIFVAYGFSDNCLGTAFELALACDRVYSFNARALVGFPELKLDLFPVGGIFQELAERFDWSRKLWQEEPFFTALKASDMGLIRLVANAPNWQEILTRRISTLTDEALRPDFSAKLSRSSKLLGASSEESLTFQEALGSFEHSNYLKSAATASKSSELIWGFVRGSARPEQKEIEMICGYACARHLVSRDFLLAFGRLIKLKQTNYIQPVSAKNCVYVDLGYIAPPTESLWRLIATGYGIIFCGWEAVSLSEVLALIFTRLEKQYPPEEVRAAWEHSIAWFVGDLDLTSKTTLSWTVDDRLRLRSQNKNIELLRFSGNRGESKSGWCEFQASQFSEEVQDELLISFPVLSCLCDGIVQTKSISKSNTEIGLSTLVRSIFLDELIRMAKLVNGGLERIIAALAESRWGFVADEARWDHFLRTRKESYLIAIEEVRLGPFEVSYDSWEADLWREVKELAATKTKQLPSWNPAALSQHFGILAASLAQIIAREGYTISPAHADVFVCEALGFPDSQGTPQVFMTNRNPLMLEDYQRKNWPMEKT